MVKSKFWCDCSKALAVLSLSFAVVNLLKAANSEQGTEATIPADNISDEAPEKSLPKFDVRLLWVQRDWSKPMAGQVQSDIEPRTEENQAVGQPNSAFEKGKQRTINAFLADAGYAAVYKPDDFASTCQWLRERGLIVADRPIHLEKTRFERRWTATFGPVPNSEAAQDAVWQLQVDSQPRKNPELVCYLNLKRAYVRRSPPNGPVLRGAAVDIFEGVGFDLPRERVVVLRWYSHPQDVKPASGPIPVTAEPILVIQQAQEEQTVAPQVPKVTFHRPERLLKLVLE